MEESNFDVKKYVLQRISWMLCGVAIFGLAYLLYKFLSFDPQKWTIWISSDFAGSFTKLIYLYLTVTLFELATPGKTLRAITDNTTTPEDRRNAVYLFGCVLFSTAWVLS